MRDGAEPNVWPGRRALVLRPGAIGDTLLTLPALAALRRHLRGVAVDVAGNPAALPVLAAAGATDHWLSFDDARVTRLFGGGPPTPDDPFRPLAVAVAWCADPDGALRRALERRGAEVVVTRRSRPPSDSAIHVARYLLESLAPLGVPTDGPLTWPPIEPPAEARAAARADLEALGLDGRPFLVVQPGSGSADKNWPPERFARVLDAAERDLGLSPLVVGGPADREAAARLRARAATAVPILWDRPLLVVAALLARSRAYLGNDSGLSHLAGLLGVPTLVLFGPTDPTHWAPLGPRVRLLRHRPLAELPVDRVLAELAALTAGA